MCFLEEVFLKGLSLLDAGLGKENILGKSDHLN